MGDPEEVNPAINRNGALAHSFRISIIYRGFSQTFLAKTNRP